MYIVHVSKKGPIKIYPYYSHYNVQICLSSTPSTMMTGLDCGHRFCHSCWAEYLTTKIMSEGIGQTISCAAHNCEILIDDATVMKLVPDAKVRLKYQHLITNSFVEVCTNWLSCNG